MPKSECRRPPGAVRGHHVKVERVDAFVHILKRWLATLTAFGWLAACTAMPPALNSEMIQASFGSYDLQVLSQSARLRISDLYSGVGAQRVTRTLAVVMMPESVPVELESAHAAIVAGGSLGATLKAAGWTVEKTHLSYASLNATPALAARMKIAPATPLAIHIYALVAKRGQQRANYALIGELHHPDHLGKQQLESLYGPLSGPASARRQEVETMRELITEAAATAFQRP